MLRVCVIGMGPIGNLHADIYKADELSELVGVCDIIKQRADGAAERLGVRPFHDAQSMLDALRPDVVSVATGGYEYGSDHYEPTIQALEAGCHVLCEKPICNEIAKAEEMVATAGRKQRCFGVDLNHRFTPAARLARKWLDEGRLGHLLFVNMAMWIKNPNESSPYFQIKALHPHTVDVMRYFCGDVKAVHAFLGKGKGRTIWSNAQVGMAFANGVVGNLTGSYDAGGSFGLEQCDVAGSDGRFVLDDACEHLSFYPRKGMQTERFDYLGGMMSFAETFKSRISFWIDQLLAKTPPEKIEASGADALKAQKIIEAAIASSQTGKTVEV